MTIMKTQLSMPLLAHKLTNLDREQWPAFRYLVVHGLVDDARDVRPVCSGPVRVVRPYGARDLTSDPMGQAS